MGTRYTRAQARAYKEYIKRHFDSMTVRVPKGKKAEYKAKAEALGVSLNQFVVDALEKAL